MAALQFGERQQERLFTFGWAGAFAFAGWDRMAELRRLTPEEIVSTLADGAPGMDWELEKVMPDGSRALVPYRMQVLRAAENIDALKCAQQTAKSIGELKEYGDIYREAQAHEILVRAVRRREKRDRNDGTGTSYYPQIWMTTDQLRASLTEMEMAALLNAYEVTRNEFGVVDGLEAHDAESWIARLSDPLQGPFYLSQLDSRHWPGLCLLLAKECARNYEELGRKLPSLLPTSEFEPESSTSSTGSSPTPPTASSTGPNPITVPGDSLLSKDEAQAIVDKRKRGSKPEPES